MSELPKVSQQLSDPISENLQKLATLFPAAVKDGELDIEALREELGDFAEIQLGDEKYELNWAGKQAAKKEAFQPLLGKTLKYVAEDSKDPETTENIYIEGDNLEALKLLRQNYYGSVKMVYIDPPYNTGKDFVYKDNFKSSAAESDEAEGLRAETGERLVKNEKSNNRFHANWLSMMYPRLQLAKGLLREDGVIFISIDDNEVHNLRQLCDEVFGAANFVAELIHVGNSSKNNAKNISTNHEYIFCIAKSKELISLNQVKKNNIDEFLNRIKKLTKLSTDEQSKEIEQLVKYPRFYDFDHYTKIDAVGVYRCNDMTAPGSKNFHEIKHPITGEVCRNSSRGWAYAPSKIDEMISEGRISFGVDHKKIPEVKGYLSDNLTSTSKSVLFHDSQIDTKQLKEAKIPFDYPKPTALLRHLIQLAVNQNEIVLDFFSGSASSAHAVMQLNAEDGKGRKHIMVQLPEVCDSKSEAAKAGYKTIAEIGKKRIRRAGDKIKAELVEKANTATTEDKQANPCLAAPIHSTSVLRPSASKTHRSTG